MSFECTREPCWARPIDEVDGACAASPAFKACRFRTSLRANGEHTDDAEVLRPTPGEAEAVWPTPPAPPSQGGEKKAARAQQKRSFGGRLFNPVNTNFAPRQHTTRQWLARRRAKYVPSRCVARHAGNSVRRSSDGWLARQRDVKSCMIRKVGTTCAVGGLKVRAGLFTLLCGKRQRFPVPITRRVDA